MSDEGDAFFETWKASYDEMKRVSPDLVTCLSFGLGPEEHLKAFIETMKEKECVPEIFAFRSFGTVIYGEEEEKMNLIQNNESRPASRNKNRRPHLHCRHTIPNLSPP